MPNPSLYKFLNWITNLPVALEDALASALVLPLNTTTAMGNTDSLVNVWNAAVGGSNQIPALTGAVVSVGATLATTETIDLMVTIGNGVTVINTGVGANWTAPFDFGATIVSWSIVAAQGGAISIDVWKCTYTQFDAGATHPVAADKISASAPIVFAATTTKATSSLLTGWTTGVNINDILAFNVASVTTCTQVTLNLKLTKTS